MADMIIAELEELLQNDESDRVERKASASGNEDKIRETICAFANDLPNHSEPGVIFIGVNDNGSCSNLPITDELIQKLSQIRLDGHILPVPSMTVAKHILRGCEVAVITVSPSISPPVRYKGRTWIRIGSTLQIATPDDERRLTERRRSNDLPFDRQAASNASLADLDIDFFKKNYLFSAIAPDILEQNQRTLEDQLLSLGFLTKDNVPTYGAVLMLGKNPLDFVPGAYVDFLRIEGTSIPNPIKNSKQLSGPLFEVLRMLDELLQINISTSVDITSGNQEIRKPDYPLTALQQLARNALMHRNYETSNAPVRINWFSDHIEIQNPGGLYGQVNKENFGKVTDYRNPLIAEAMKVLGYVQRFGWGISLAKSELAKNGNPEPEFNFEQTYFGVTIKKAE